MNKTIFRKGMTNTELLQFCLDQKWGFARRMWDNGWEWFVEAWSPEAQDWIEHNDKRLIRAVKRVVASLEETKKDSAR